MVKRGRPSGLDFVFLGEEMMVLLLMLGEQGKALRPEETGPSFKLKLLLRALARGS